MFRSEMTQVNAETSGKSSNDSMDLELQCPVEGGGAIEMPASQVDGL
jgi:hypothetical protein